MIKIVVLVNILLNYLVQNEESIKCDCVNCGKTISISEMRIHMDVCNGGSSKSW